MSEEVVRGPWDLGRPGFSARAEYQRLLDNEAARRRDVFGRYLGPVVDAVAGPSKEASAWAKGGKGEEAVGHYLTRVVGAHGVVLHDRAVPEGRANIDHIAIVPSGVWVIDTKRYRGRVEQRGGWFRSPPALFVDGHNRTNLVTGALQQRQMVQRFLGPKVPVQAALCFADADWGLFAKPLHLNDVMVTWPRRLGGSLLAGGGQLAARERDELAQRLGVAFPAYVPGTSHSPTGA
ncbi:MAG: nuclease-related domain-containing protein [Acidimicrobiales bacterium]